MEKNMSLKPLGDRVVVKPDDAETKSSGGLILTTHEDQLQGTVIAVGPGAYQTETLIPMEVAFGDKVVYPKNVGTTVTVDTESFLIIKESDILAIKG
jgi:chaperonin GroES